MNPKATTLTERGQISIPAFVRKKLNLKPGQRLVWEPISNSECRVRVDARHEAQGAESMLGFMAKRRKARRTKAWMEQLRSGE